MTTLPSGTLALTIILMTTHAASAQARRQSAQQQWRYLSGSIGFQTLEEYYSYLEVNSLPQSEPGYLHYCTAANQHKHSACLDGSPQSFYFRPGSAWSATKFHLYFQGGGWCAGIDDGIGSPACFQNCHDRATTTSKGSSLYDPNYLYYRDMNYLSSEFRFNPLAWDWNTVYIRYCDGASFSGNNESEIVSADGTRLYFKGFNNVNAVLDALSGEFGLLDATDVLLTGSSAGGLAVYLHADHIAEYLNVKERNINFMAMADSGWFPDYEGRGRYSDCMRWVFETQNTSIALNAQCLEQQVEGHRCMFAEHSAPFIESNLMVVQSRFDSWQTAKQLVSANIAEINAFGKELAGSIMLNFMAETGGGNGQSRRRMAFLDSCFHHNYQDEWIGLEIDGCSAAQAQVDFWFDSSPWTDMYFQNESYPCNACCSSNVI